jgi:single-strand DNA-binding protein
MFNDLNEVRLIGNVTNDPEVRFTPSGAAVLSFGLATNRNYKQGEEWKEEVTFHNIVVWGPRAQSLGERMQRGTKVFVAGRLQTRTWDGQDGRKNYKTEIVADTVTLLSRYQGEGMKSGSFTPNTPKAATGKSKGGEESNDNEFTPGGDDVINPDDLPF